MGFAVDSDRLLTRARRSAYPCWKPFSELHVEERAYLLARLPEHIDPVIVLGDVDGNWTTVATTGAASYDGEQVVSSDFASGWEEIRWSPVDSDGLPGKCRRAPSIGLTLQIRRGQVVTSTAGMDRIEWFYSGQTTFTPQFLENRANYPCNVSPMRAARVKAMRTENGADRAIGRDAVGDWNDYRGHRDVEVRGIFKPGLASRPRQPGRLVDVAEPG